LVGIDVGLSVDGTTAGYNEGIYQLGPHTRPQQLHLPNREPNFEPIGNRMDLIFLDLVGSEQIALTMTGFPMDAMDLNFIPSRHRW